MRNPYKPYHHTDGKWYVSKRGKFYRALGAYNTVEEAALEAVKTHGRDLQAALDKCNEYVAKHDPNFREHDPLAYLS